MALLGQKRPARKPTRREKEVASRETRNVSDADSQWLTVERLAHDGRGVAHDENGKTQFIDQALPGERVTLAIHRTHKRFNEAHVRSRDNAAESRVTPPCAHFGTCGGCDLQHMALPAQRTHKVQVLSEHAQRNGVALADIQPLGEDEHRYRRRARLGVRVTDSGEIQLGFRGRGSNQLVDIQSCSVLVPALDRLITPLRELINTLEAPKRLGHLELTAADDQVILVIRQLKAVPRDAERWQAFAEQHGLVVGWRVGRDPVVLEWLAGTPDAAYSVRVGERTLRLAFSPGDFVQVNAALNQRLVDTALDWLGDVSGLAVMDLYAGVGNLTLAVAAAGAAKVTGIEGSQGMVDQLIANAEHNALPQVSARRADLSRALPSLEGIDLLVLDPPRDGAQPLCDELARHLHAGKVSHAPARVLYIACDPTTLMRDVKMLTDAGYRVTRALMADMFVHTAHLESMLLLERMED
ncbi:23S rRNA (uracil(1939)-C(5))-methyltransferase RlmD [Cobetia marina]|jgi:23S rRNA (uracil1939-C5)-methyltransferase|uniref:23S rRNA (uracil(1939)-C(5))-methyltransferase RlmD n=1 Tax=Cobetia TaxID=204286 RepID=UPI001596F92E|nr:MULTISPECIES: 23S rRNA (uracil(1939)-C(5))-methyltransferase RlmD [Cobetia]MDA5562054.1 23S rRNA (uracil(1939)-C(5))-methyltransferase RlmD [Cobetia sp. MMG027]MDH2290466.1 23S rRNA (uracil(1939)-C(5))-methyltransferase RlmD [Cobetia sp. 10Alg 146]MDO6787873.1 23S rRNA (uracil(1939)-C(5))-methyltransferase RlmD [Cobetia marina]